MAKRGRPIGSLSSNKPKIQDYVSPEQFGKVMAKAVDLALAGNETMIKFLGDHFMGKPMQPVEGSFTGDMVLQFDQTFQAKK